MKFFTNLFIIFFISFAAYLLMNEKTGQAKRIRAKRVVEISGLTPKKTGRIPARVPERDLFLFEIQRQRINDETIYKFHSNDTNESFELGESDLDKRGN